MSQVSRGMSAKTNQTRHSKAGPQEEQPVVQLDKRCVTCSDHPGQLIQLFKLACLSYFPGKVEYEGQKYRKGYLIDKQDELVHELRQILQDSGAALDPAQITAQERVQAGDAKNRVASDDGSAADEGETQMNSE